MLITHNQLKEINKVQVEILKEINSVCEKLNIKYFMVHGSLLGTIKSNAFIPDDDDIDIALFREDYELLIKNAPKLFKPNYFIQTAFTDSPYVLEFAKVRDSSTTYIIESTKNMNINHGIYIDVFPIDYATTSKIKSFFFKLKYKLLQTRITSKLDLNKLSFKRKIATFFSKVIYPSFNKAVVKREKLLKSQKPSNLIRVSGGKVAEQFISKDWFNTAVPSSFEGVQVYVPNGYHEYLTKIYGDYNNRTLIENKISNELEIEVNACVVDAYKPFKDYVNKN